MSNELGKLNKDYLPKEMDNERLKNKPDSKADNGEADFEMQPLQAEESISDSESLDNNGIDIVRLYFDQISASPILSQEEERHLAEQIAGGSESAKEQFVVSNLRLVIMEAKKYQNRGLAIEDLIQAGNLGLMKAVERFDYHRKNKFSTYAVFWIRKAILKEIANHGQTIRVPEKTLYQTRKLNKAKSDLLSELGRDPTYEELKERTGVPIDKIKEIENAGYKTVSLDTPIGDDGKAEQIDFLTNKTALNPEELTIAALEEKSKSDHNLLDEREFLVLELSFGLNGEEKHSLEEIGEIMNLPRERVRQIGVVALRKLRNQSS